MLCFFCSFTHFTLLYGHNFFSLSTWNTDNHIVILGDYCPHKKYPRKLSLNNAIRTNNGFSFWSTYKVIIGLHQCTKKCTGVVPQFMCLLPNRNRIMSSVKDYMTKAYLFIVVTFLWTTPNISTIVFPCFIITLVS